MERSKCLQYGSRMIVQMRMRFCFHEFPPCGEQQWPTATWRSSHRPLGQVPRSLAGLLLFGTEGTGAPASESTVVSGPSKPHKHRDPIFWFLGPRQRDFRNHCLSNDYVYVIFWLLELCRKQVLSNCKSPALKAPFCWRILASPTIITPPSNKSQDPRTKFRRC